MTARKGLLEKRP